MYERTHASFFSGVGGLDLGLERAGWRTVSFSEIDPYASAVLAERWPGVPNLGSIVELADADAGSERDRGPAGRGAHAGLDGVAGRIPSATLWTGGFPCQDLSVAGKRRGMVAGTRSGLAYSFLTLAERHRPRFVLLENVPGLLSSHGGRDMAALLGALVELGYGVGYRMLDARYFGVPQRRRRVFILGDSLGGRAGAERASEVLSIGSVCQRHPPTGRDTGSSPASLTGGGADSPQSERVWSDRGPGPNLDTGRAVPSVFADPPHDAGGQAGGRQGAAAVRGRVPDPRHRERPDAVHGTDGAEADARGDGAPDGLAGWLDDRGGLAATLNSGGNSGGFRTEPGEHLVTSFVKVSRPKGPGGIGERWSEEDTAPTLNDFDLGSDVRSVVNIVGRSEPTDDDLLPVGIDSHRYRCCGNGVVSSVAEFIGERLAAIA